MLRALRKMAGKGLTIAAVIHQPSLALFRQFDAVLLFQRGGKCVYFGPIKEMASYFQRLLPQVDLGDNPIDNIMELISQPEVGRFLVHLAFICLLSLSLSLTVLFSLFVKCKLHHISSVVSSTAPSISIVVYSPIYHPSVRLPFSLSFVRSFSGSLSLFTSRYVSLSLHRLTAHLTIHLSRFAFLPLGCVSSSR